MPGPAWTRDPKPVTAAELKSVPCVTVLLRLKTNVPFVVIVAEALDESEPAAPPRQFAGCHR